MVIHFLTLGLKNHCMATPEQMFHMLFRSSVIDQATEKMSMLLNGEKQKARFANRYVEIFVI